MTEEEYPPHWFVTEVEGKCGYCGSDTIVINITCGCGDSWTEYKCEVCDG